MTCLQLAQTAAAAAFMMRSVWLTSRHCPFEDTMHVPEVDTLTTPWPHDTGHSGGSVLMQWYVTGTVGGGVIGRVGIGVGYSVGLDAAVGALVADCCTIAATTAAARAGSFWPSMVAAVAASTALSTFAAAAWSIDPRAFAAAAASIDSSGALVGAGVAPQQYRPPGQGTHEEEKATVAHLFSYGLYSHDLYSYGQGGEKATEEHQQSDQQESQEHWR